MTGRQACAGGGERGSPPQKNAWEPRPYPEYKDSKLPWLGKIPKHWEEKRAKYIFHAVEERSITGNELRLAMSQKLGLVPHSEIKEHRLQSESYAGAKLCRVNDIVMNRLKAHLGVFAIVRQPGIVSPDYTVFRPAQSIDPEYYEYLLKSPVFRPELIRRAKGIIEGFWRLYTDDFYDVRLPVPALDEQQRIVRFLQYQDRSLTQYIRAKRRLIELLNEQKQAIISRAVTQGIDPNVRLKPSGIEWVGDVPEHWVIKPLKHWVAINKCALSEKTQPDYSFNYLDIGSVGTGFLIKTPEKLYFSDAPSRARRILKKGDSIISTVRTYLKAIYFVDSIEDNLIASTGFAVLSPKENVYPEYLGYLIQSSVFIDQVTANSVGIAYPAIAETKIGSFNIALPPNKEEQEMILHEIKVKTASIDLSISHTQQEIDLINEYRTRIISDVITGKADIREIKLPAPEPFDERDIRGVNGLNTLSNEYNGVKREE